MTLLLKVFLPQLHSPILPAGDTVWLITHRFLLDKKLCIFEMACNVLTQAFPMLLIQYFQIEIPHLLIENRGQGIR